MFREQDHPRVKSGSTAGQFTDAGNAIRAAASDDKHNAVQVYQSTLFDSINNELRYDRPDKYKDIINELDKVAKDVTEDKLYRGLDSNYLKQLAQDYKINDINNVAELQDKLIGKTIHDKSFMSTSRELSVAADFARDKGKGRTTVLQIDGKKQGIEVTKHVNNYRARQEKEFLIKRNSTLIIKNVSLSKTGKLILYTEIK